MSILWPEKYNDKNMIVVRASTIVALKILNSLSLGHGGDQRM
jgi:hypothetical protein